ncbi:MAG: hypothetical protein ACRYFU_18890 [Janthinobacterium lividum]
MEAPEALTEVVEVETVGPSLSSEAEVAELAEGVKAKPGIVGPAIAVVATWTGSAFRPLPEAASSSDVAGVYDTVVVEAGTISSAAIGPPFWESGATPAVACAVITGACGSTGKVCVGASAWVDEVLALASLLALFRMPAALLFLLPVLASVLVFPLCWA